MNNHIISTIIPQKIYAPSLSTKSCRRMTTPAEIFDKIGEWDTFLRVYSAEIQQYTDGHIMEGVRKGFPTLEAVRRTYGHEVTAGFITHHISQAFLRLGFFDRLENAEFMRLCECILMNERLGNLCFLNVIRFAWKLGRGDYKTYNHSPQYIISALNSYISEVSRQESECLAQVEAELREEEAQDSSADQTVRPSSLQQALCQQPVFRGCRGDDESAGRDARKDEQERRRQSAGRYVRAPKDQPHSMAEENRPRPEAPRTARQRPRYAP